MKVDYITLAVPFFFVLIAIELAYSFYKKLGYYRLNDAIANLSQGIGSQIVGLFMKAALFFGYMYIYENLRVGTVPKTVLTWFVLFIGVDFFYYWFHRMSHQINALWAAHIVHHQSEEYNLTVALRQSWFQGWFSWVFYLPLAFAGFDPIMFLTISAFNTLYQFWIHTRAIKHMGFLEHIINTPSHHRVHHGSNPKYIDKNHAGTLIIWDKLFGTFQAEEEEVYYGITSPLQSWNPVWANIHYWQELIQVAKQSKSIGDKIRVFIKPPGWFPENLGGFKNAPEIDVANYKKFDTSSKADVVIYAVVLFLLALTVGATQLFLHVKLSLIENIVLAFYVIGTLLACGALLEQKRWFLYLDFFRIFFEFIILYYCYKQGMSWPILVAISLLKICLIALFNQIRNRFHND